MKEKRDSAAVWLVLVVLLSLSPVALAQDSEGKKDPTLIEQTEKLLVRIERNRVEIDALRVEQGDSQGEDVVLLERRLRRVGLETLADVDTFVGNIVELEQEGHDVAALREAAVELLEALAPLVRRRIAALREDISNLTGERESASGEALINIERDLATANETLSIVLRAGLDNATHMETLGVDPSLAATEKAYLSEILVERAKLTAERVDLAMDQISATQDRLKEKPDDADLLTLLAANEAKLASNRAVLVATIEMLDELEIETTEYQQLLIEATGQITSDILDSGVAVGLLQQWLNGLREWIVQNGPPMFFRTLVFLLILFVFRILSRLTRRVVRRAVSSSKLNFSLLLQKMFVSVSGNVVMAVGLLVALSQIGFSLGPVLAGLGIMGFIVGFALQDTLGNFASGLMILVYRPFDVGDMIDAAGVFGKVDAMSLVSTTVLTIDNQTLVIPNSKIWGDVIKNVTAQTVRRVDLVFGIGYGDDIPKAEAVLADILKEHPKVLADPEPMIRLHNLGDSSVDFIVRPWVETGDYWDVYWDVTREVKLRFDREGISIPFPQRDIHHYDEVRVPIPQSAAANPRFSTSSKEGTDPPDNDG